MCKAADFGRGQTQRQTADTFIIVNIRCLILSIINYKLLYLLFTAHHILVSMDKHLTKDQMAKEKRSENTRDVGDLTVMVTTNSGRGSWF